MPGDDWWWCESCAVVWLRDAVEGRRCWNCGGRGEDLPREVRERHPRACLKLEPNDERWVREVRP